MIRVFMLLGMLAVPLDRANAEADKLLTAGVAEFTEAYRSWDGARFEAAAAWFRQACTNESATAMAYYWLGTAEFHRMLQLQSLLPPTAAHQKAAEAAREAAIDALTRAVTRNDRDAESHALLGTLYGMKIQGSLLRAAWFGPDVQKHRKAALAAGANDPRVQYLMGMCQFHTAKSAADWRAALATLLAAEKLFDAEAKTAAGPFEPRWGRDSCLTFIGRAYETLARPSEAAVYFRRALALHPQDTIAQAGLKRVADIPRP